jgi:hypothetical protein
VKVKPKAKPILSKVTQGAIRLDQAPVILQTADAVLRPGPGTLGPPWIVAATARALESATTKPTGQLVALAASGCSHVEGLSTWVAVLGVGSSQALAQLRDLAVSAGHPVHLESAPLSEYPFAPFLVREKSSTSLLFPKGGGPGMNDWVLGMVDDVSDIAQVAAVTEMIGKRFSFRDFAALPGGFKIEPIQQKAL